MNENMKKQKIKDLKIIGIVAFIVVLAIALAFVINPVSKNNVNDMNKFQDPTGYTTAGTELFPEKGFKTKIILGDAIVRLVKNGAIDLEQFKQIYSYRDSLSEEQLELLTKPNYEPLVLTQESANFLINLLWPLGVANKNPILDEVENYEGVANLASTGGWSLGKEDAMTYFNKLELIKLTPKQQSVLEEVANNAYRPCCNNPTSFPDCNHGAALLALLELGASQDLSKEELYTLALQANTLWFPQQYLSTQVLFNSQNRGYWDNAKEIISEKYSSYSGWVNNVYKPLQEQGLLPKVEGGGSCGV